MRCVLVCFLVVFASAGCARQVVIDPELVPAWHIGEQIRAASASDEHREHQ